MKKSCIIFACTILTDDRLFVLEEFLQEFAQDFLECDIYVGINPVSTLKVEEVLKNSNLKVISERAPLDLYTSSDASAYQIALRLVRDSKNSYDTYWFVHTKGGVNSHSDYLRKWYIDTLLKDRIYIEDLLYNNEDIGSYGLLGLEYDTNKVYSETDVEISLFENELSKELPCTHAKFFYIHSLYAVRGEIVDKLFSLTTDKWFKEKLNRYYFEGVFPFIVSRLGYFPYLSNRTSATGVDLINFQDSWISENNLVHYKKYNNIYRTNYKFDQLNPPYVNSNP
jgi:hypothetical protein